MSEVPKAIQKLELDLSQVTRTKSILNQNQIQKLWNSTKPKYKYVRPAKGGGNWTYVKVSYVRKVLDSVFGFDWDFEIETSLEEAFNIAKMSGGIVLKGKLTMRVIDDSGRIREIVKQQFGRSDVKWQMENQYDEQGRQVKINGKPKKTKKIDEYTGSPIPLDIGNDFKAAASDCLKKCASLIGVAADVYEAEEFMEIIITDSDEDKSKGTKKLAKEQKKLLNQESKQVGNQNDSAK